jgi:hypothetical protein
MSDHEISPFLLSIKKTEVRYSLLAPFPWCAIEYPNINSKFPDAIYFGHEITELATAMADVHSYTGDDRRAYIARLVHVGMESKAQWDREPFPESGPLPDAYVAATVARMQADKTREEAGKGEAVSVEDLFNSCFRNPPMVKKTWWSNWTPVPWDNICLAIAVAVAFITFVVLIHTILTQ